AELRWLSPGTFRFRRVLNGELPKIAWTDRDPVAIETADTPAAVRLRTRALEVTVSKRGVLVEVRRVDGVPLMQDLSEPQSEAVGVIWERQVAPGIDFFGLGPRTDPTFALRGKNVRAETPMLVSTAGYGEFHAGAGTYRFDF